MALSVVMTGAPAGSRSFLISSAGPGPERPPAGQDDRPLGAGQDRGRPVDRILGNHGAEPGAGRRGRGRLHRIAPRIRSWGKNSAAGRGRPVVIAWNAWPTIAGICSLRRTVPHHFVTGRKIASRSISW